MHGPDKLQFYITLSWRGFPGTNTLAYWSHSWVKKMLKFCENDSRSSRVIFPSFQITVCCRVTNICNKVECLFLGSPSSLVYCLWLWPRAYPRVERLKFYSFGPTQSCKNFFCRNLQQNLRKSFTFWLKLRQNCCNLLFKKFL